jgi:tetratricopeptide (TPR) repeat protein
LFRAHSPEHAAPNVDGVAFSEALAVGRHVGDEWSAVDATARKLARIITAIGFLLIVVAVVGRPVDDDAFKGVLAGLTCLLVGSVVLMLCGIRFFWRGRRFKAAVQAVLDARFDGDGRAAAVASERALAMLPKSFAPWAIFNCVIEAHVTGGRYAEALSLAKRWSDGARARGVELGPNGWALVQINLAEAEYCAGDIDAAKQRMDHLFHCIEHERAPFDVHAVASIVRHGGMTQRAWIAALQGEAGEALRFIESVDAQLLPAEYRAEVHYTRAFALSRAGEHEAAERTARQGAALATRASSIRNGVFLLGTLACAREDFEAAVVHFELGASHSYRGQGGDALLAFSRALSRLGRADQAEATAHLVLERDPQSAAAASIRASR